MSEHRGSSLLEDLEASELAALGSNIDINDAAVCGFKVDGVDVQEVLSKIDAAHFGAVLSAHVGHLLKSQLDHSNELIRVFIGQRASRRY